MAYGISASSGKIGYNVKHYTVDEFDDMKKLPTSGAAGSTAFVVLTSQHFMLNNKRQWVEIIPGGSSGSGQEGIIWDGGSPDGNECPCECCSNSDDASTETENYIWDGGEVNG